LDAAAKRQLVAVAAKSKPAASIGEFNASQVLQSLHGFAGQLKSGAVHNLRTTTIKLPEPAPERTGEEVRADPREVAHEPGRLCCPPQRAARNGQELGGKQTQADPRGVEAPLFRGQIPGDVRA
jgi:hypothetical protein